MEFREHLWLSRVTQKMERAAICLKKTKFVPGSIFFSSKCPVIPPEPQGLGLRARFAEGHLGEGMELPLAGRTPHLENDEKGHHQHVLHWLP